MARVVQPRRAHLQEFPGGTQNFTCSSNDSRNKTTKNSPDSNNRYINNSKTSKIFVLVEMRESSGFRTRAIPEELRMVSLCVLLIRSTLLRM